MPNDTRATIIGHVAREPEEFAYSGGKVGCRFSMATNSGKGERRSTTWWAVTVFSEYTMRDAMRLAKGDAVTVHARNLEMRVYTKNNGDVGGEMRCIADRCDKIDYQKFEGGSDYGNASKAAPPPADIPSDDIPF